MRWKGMAIGGCLGSLFGGPLGALLGAALGRQVEERLFVSNAKLAEKVAEEYAILGVTKNTPLAEIQAKYRELAKKYHPDSLRAQGLPEEMIGKATEKMGKINAAWSRIKASHGKLV